MDQKVKSHVVLNQEDYSKFRVFLKQNNIVYEPSGYGQDVYVSLRVNQKEHSLINSFLLTL